MKPQFPLQAKFIGYASTLVVNFTDEHKGTVVTADENGDVGDVGDESNEIGYYSEHWTSCFRAGLWEIIKKAPSEDEAKTKQL